MLVLQEGKIVQLCFPASTSQVYFFEKEEEATQFLTICDRLEKFMKGIVPEERFDISFKQLLLEYITKYHVPIVSMREEKFNLPDMK